VIVRELSRRQHAILARPAKVGQQQTFSFGAFLAFIWRRALLLSAGLPLEPTVKFSAARSSMFIVLLSLSGCCYFVPCHPAGHVSGTVIDTVSRRPVSNAAVRLYSYTALSTQSGCFALGGADAFPFEFGVSAPGYKPTTLKAAPGWFVATVELVPEDRTGVSKSKIREVSEDRYTELSRRCP
jgi:hypothetical protein